MLRLRAARAVIFAVTTAAASMLVAACGDDPAPTVLQELDTKAVEDAPAPFDRNEVVDFASFTDIDGLDITLIQQFLHRTPYQRPSFLETYQSNGVRAGEAIARASRTYRINPLVFLIYSQAVQGLVGEQTYPFPPERVEYVFGCGCMASDNCLPALAGYDRQVDCLGRALRVALDEVAANGETTSGWGTDQTSLTLDGLKVTPADASTAALYDHTPVVAQGKEGGTWLLWNLWNLYASTISYSGPIGGASGGGIGDACVSDGSCGFEGATCAKNYPGGLCTVECTGDCPSDPSRTQAYCVAFDDGGFCFPVCNPGAAACREGYTCQRLARYGSDTESEFVCFRDPTSP